jgi:aryl-alcohol dehydrogenase-like predicted oxidoreductase
VSLEPRQLGGSGLAITALGLGSWAIGGAGSEGYGRQDDQDSLASIHRAVRIGINWIDTAPIYGLGHSEEIVGRALAQMAPADRPYVFTKCGLIPDPSRPNDRPRRILTPESMRRELESSLRRLGVERIDLYQAHRPDEIGTPVEDSWGEMGRFIEEGKIRAAGVSNFQLHELEAYEAIRHIDSLQPPFSLVHRDAAELIAWCAAKGVGIIAYSPMASGLMTDGFSAQRAASLPSDDWRHDDVEYQGVRLARNLELRDALRPIARRHQAPVAAVAVAWVLAWPGVTGAIVGARRASQVDDWARALDIQLTDQDLTEISAAIARTGAGTGPARGPAD